MRVTHHESAAALLQRAGAFLEAAEAENGLLLGIATAAARTPPLGDARARSKATWITVDTAGATVGVALRTPPYNLLLSRMPHEALHALVADLAARDAGDASRRARGESAETLPGVSGPRETASAFAALWTRATGSSRSTTMRQGLYELTRVALPTAPPRGALRVARSNEERRLADWTEHFARDALLPQAEHAPLRRGVAALIAAGGLFVWDDEGEARSMVALQGTTRHGVRVSLVYTPREQRGRGYASACVAAVSERALASGRRFCILYADAANATSNGIYQRVGYRVIGEAVMIAFTDATPSP